VTVPVDRLSAVSAGRHAIQTASRFNAKGSGDGGKEQHTYLTARPPFRSIGGYLPLLRERFGPSSGDRLTWGSARPSRSSPAWCRSGPARRSPGRPCWLRGRSGRPLPVKRDNNPVQTAALKRLVEPFIDATFSSMRLQLLPASRRGVALTECSRPDYANPCKHIAGVYYRLASQLDRDPFLLFEPRGLSREQLRQALRATPLGKALAPLAEEQSAPIQAAEWDIDCRGPFQYRGSPFGSFQTRVRPCGASTPGQLPDIGHGFSSPRLSRPTRIR
jgi:hypothetical protein